jgi:hypothetical protein
MLEITNSSLPDGALAARCAPRHRAQNQIAGARALSRPSAGAARADG